MKRLARHCVSALAHLTFFSLSSVTFAMTSACESAVTPSSSVSVRKFLSEASLEELRIGGRFTNLRPMPRQEGGRQHDLQIAEFQGETVALKGNGPRINIRMQIDNRERLVPAILHEAAFLKILGEAGVGPKFYGVARVEGEEVLVMEYVPNASLSTSYKLNKALRCRTPQELDQIEAQLRAKIEKVSNLDIALIDFQYLLTEEDRVVPIDFERYARRKITPGHTNSTKNENDEILERSIRSLRANFTGPTSQCVEK